MPDTHSLVLDTVRDLVRRRHGEDRPIDLDADLFDDLELDSLDVAELSAVLEEQKGTDPYSQGEVARTVREVLGFYEQLAT